MKKIIIIFVISLSLSAAHTKTMEMNALGQLKKHETPLILIKICAKHAYGPHRIWCQQRPNISHGWEFNSAKEIPADFFKQDIFKLIEKTPTQKYIEAALHDKATMDLLAQPIEKVLLNPIYKTFMKAFDQLDEKNKVDILIYALWDNQLCATIANKKSAWFDIFRKNILNLACHPELDGRNRIQDLQKKTGRIKFPLLKRLENSNKSGFRILLDAIEDRLKTFNPAFEIMALIQYKDLSKK